MRGAGRYERLFSIDEHHLGPQKAAVIRSREVAAIQGFLKYYLNGDAVGTKVSVRNRQGGRYSGVAVKRGSTVILAIVTKIS